MVTRFLFLMLCFLNTIQIAMLIALTSFLSQKTVFNIDQVRAAYVEGLTYNYHEACRIGIDDYPEEYRTAHVVGFNVNNSMNWCTNLVQRKKDEFFREAVRDVR